MIISVNGLQLHYEERGDGDPMLLLHGGTGIGSDWQAVFTGGDPDGFRVIVPDLRGHGRSTNPSRAFTFRQAALDMFALLDHLDITRVKAIGLSMHGDRDPLYPVELALEMYRAIPSSALWIVPNGGHGPIFGAMAGPFVETALAHLRHHA
jgi:pimeloyl-ACP methyl ester carboxylesterase